ncbi:hypothetical protein IAG43_31375 [Streptomyces genisteinicus]|uniref:DUF7824 domain-containing protein n=1 Tax=Streptomyces genisteinicus TaxID=2768068 RepID=A0A7H0I4I3_9ACTN|nr:hypothetical protein IAG43_31375 [Streptomyces genisteinicus]
MPALVAPLDRARRRDLLAALKELRGDLRASGWDRWDERVRVSPALLVAGAACQTGAAAAASWIGGRDMRLRGRVPVRELVEVLEDRTPRWLGDLAHRLAARASTARDDYPLVRELVRRAGCPMPTADGCVDGWATEAWTERGRLTDVLRRDPHLTAFAPRLFETPEPVASLAAHHEPGAPEQWPGALAALAAEGRLDRAVLLDACTARLLRGGPVLQLKPYRAVLESLRPTPEEERERTADWIALTADAPSPVAGQAQEVLARLAAAGQLAPARLAEMSAGVFFRPEKKLVRAQLTLLGRALARDPGTASVLLPVLGEAFGHPDTDVQERALKLAAAHLGDDGDLRARLAGLAHLLSPVHRARAVALLGADAAPAEEPGPYEEILPPLLPPAPLGPSPASVEETVELVAAVVNARVAPVEEFERALDGLVRHAHRDRAALAAALRPALADRYWLDPARRHYYTDDLPGLEHVAAAVLDARPSGPKPEALVTWRSDCHHADAAAARHARVVEAARGVVDGSLPFLLSTPTLTSGSLDPDALVSRLAEYARTGTRPGPVDFAQALFRVRRDASALPGAAALGTPEGERLAAWLGESGRPAAVTRRAGGVGFHGRDTLDRHLLDTGERAAAAAEFPPAFRALAAAREGAGRCWDAGDPDVLIAMLPEDRDTLAAWSLARVTSCALDDERGGTDMLPGLAAAGPAGPAGPALHLAVATGLGARHADDRLRSVDALLTLAGRRELDTALLGADLCELLEMGTVKPGRLADALRTAAATGAHATVWAVLSGVLPVLLTGSGDPRGTGELVETAAECAEQSRAVAEPLAGLEAVAARPGRSRLVTQAARLRDALRRNREAAATAVAPG